MKESQNLDIRLEKAVLLGLEVFDKDATEDMESSLDELALLADTAGVKVVGTLTQRSNFVNASHYVGKGKALEAKELIEQLEADILIVDDDLKPAQQRNLEKIVETRVIDRTELILAIFAWRARTHQAKIQVELAQQKYSLPRLRKLWTHLTSNQEKGVAGLMGGAGERQIELDRRLIRKRITALRRELDTIRDRKKLTMQNREELYTVALVGYTNAGKSTLMNKLTDADVFVEDKLFATLDTRTRVWKIAAGHKCLLSDTVGFIKKLPHHLIEAFNATLQEAMTADLMIHVIDASSIHSEKHIEAVQNVLEQIKAEKIPSILLFNKIDLLKGDQIDRMQFLQTIYPDSIQLSAKTGDGVDDLKQQIKLEMRKKWLPAKLKINAGNGKLINILKDETEIISEKYVDGYGYFEIFFYPRIIRKLHDAKFKGDVIYFQEPEKNEGFEGTHKPNFWVPPK